MQYQTLRNASIPKIGFGCGTIGSQATAKPAEERIARDKVNLGIFWLRDESLEDSANLPAPGVITAEIVEDLKPALEQFECVAGDLGEAG